MVADLRQADAAEHLLQAALQAHGRPDGLALCVGVCVEGASEDACAGVTGASVMLDFGLAAGY